MTNIAVSRKFRYVFSNIFEKALFVTIIWKQGTISQTVFQADNYMFQVKYKNTRFTLLFYLSF